MIPLITAIVSMRWFEQEQFCSRPWNVFNLRSFGSSYWVKISEIQSCDLTLFPQNGKVCSHELMAGSKTIAASHGAYTL